MQTFLPYPDFARSAACLDRSRLGKQRPEAIGILNELRHPGGGWANHPAVRMWRGYPQALACYGLAIAAEWQSRGYHDTSFDYFAAFLADCPDWSPDLDPPWLGDERLHASHRAALLAKLPDHYGRFGWVEAPVIDYWWPQ